MALLAPPDAGAADAPRKGAQQAPEAPADAPPPALAPAPETLEEGLGRVKADFEGSLAPLKDPIMIQALSLKETCLALFMTVTVLEPGMYGNYYSEKSRELERLWSSRKNSWDMKEVQELTLYSEALSRLVVIVAGRLNNQGILKEFNVVAASSATGKARSQPAKIAEARVYWSNRIVVLTSLLIRLASSDKAKALEDITDDLLNRSEVIASRRDVHYQARMDLLYLNNMQSLTSMLFLMASDSRSPVAAHAMEMESDWEQRIADPDFQVSEKTSLSLVSSTQLSFPLLNWLASSKQIGKGASNGKASQ
jgi:hypothetical protein